MTICLHYNSHIKGRRPAILVSFPANPRTVSGKMAFSMAVIFVACAVICASQPVDKQPVLKETPSEVLFRVSEKTQPLFLECVTKEKQEGITYKWLKDDKEFNPKEPDVMRREGEGSLIFVHPRAEDEGEYQCFAESEQGVASTRVISVKRAYINIPEIKTHKHKPVEGKPFSLSCPIPDAYPKPEITWMHQFASDPSIGNQVANSRFTISPEGTMYISSVKQEDVSDNFKYVCIAKTPALDEGVPLAEHYIESLEKNPKPDHEVYKQYVTEDITAVYGETLYLFCIYGGDPLAHPDWYKDGKNVNNSPSDRVTRYNKSKGKRLLIREVWLEDEGEYTCLIDNEVGQPQNHTFHMKVVSAPEYEVEPADKVLAKEGEDVTIPCQVAALPTAEISWTYNAKALPKSDKYVFNPTHTARNMTVGDLTIKNVQKSDKGYYGCHASNNHGDIYSEILVLV